MNAANIWRRSARSRTNKSFTAKARPLRFEALEDRRMMAYTAMADVFGGTDGAYYRGDPAPAGYVSVVQEQNLNSRPGAPATLFLDFNGHYQTERVGMDEWQDFFAPGSYGWHNILTPAWDRDGDPLNFSPAERQQIRFIWASVAEDYAPFNINVTTVDPDPGLYHTDGPYIRVVISGEADFTGKSRGGFSEYDAFANDDRANVAYVFGMSDRTLNPIRFLAEAASHEAGHTFGLGHYDKNVGNDVRAPIMAVDSYLSERGVWWDGNMNVIANSDNGFGYRADDYGNSFASAAHLTSTNAGLYARGVVEWTTDVDTFQFSTGGGNVEIKVTLPTEADDIAHPSFPFAQHRNVGNLDASLRLYDASGALVAQDSDPTLFASLTANLAAGTYYVQVGSYGLAGDVGQYSLFVNETTGPQFVVGTELWIIDPTASIPGDYNADDQVDGADFLFWRRRLGAAAVPSGSGADGNSNGIVDAADYVTWRKNVVAAAGQTQIASAASDGALDMVATGANSPAILQSTPAAAVGFVGRSSSLAEALSALEAVAAPSGNIALRSLPDAERQPMSRQSGDPIRDMAAFDGAANFSPHSLVEARRFPRKTGLTPQMAIATKAWEDHLPLLMQWLDQHDSRSKQPVFSDDLEDRANGYFEPEISTRSDLPDIDEAFAAMDERELRTAW